MLKQKQNLCDLCGLALTKNQAGRKVESEWEREEREWELDRDIAGDWMRLRRQQRQRLSSGRKRK